MRRSSPHFWRCLPLGLPLVLSYVKSSVFLVWKLAWFPLVPSVFPSSSSISSMVTPQGIDPSTVTDLSSFVAMPGSKRLLIDFFLMSVFGGMFIVPLYAFARAFSSRDPLTGDCRQQHHQLLFMIAASLALMGFYASDLRFHEYFCLCTECSGCHLYLHGCSRVLSRFAWIFVHLMYRLKATGLKPSRKEGAVV